MKQITTKQTQTIVEGVRGHQCRYTPLINVRQIQKGDNSSIRPEQDTCVICRSKKIGVNFLNTPEGVMWLVKELDKIGIGGFLNFLHYGEGRLLYRAWQSPVLIKIIADGTLPHLFIEYLEERK